MSTKNLNSLLPQSYKMHLFKRGDNTEIVKNIALCNFLIITVIYVKVHISGMEMSQRICFFIINFSGNAVCLFTFFYFFIFFFFEKMAKKSPFWLKRKL